MSFNLRDSIIFIIKPFLSIPGSRRILLFLSNHIFGNRFYRKLITNNFTSGLLAIGEQNQYFISPKWITIDIEKADINIDMSKPFKLPFPSQSQKFIYTSHTVEHLSLDSLNNLLKECRRVLVDDGILRIEAPDSIKLLNEYKNNNKEYFKSIITDNEIKLFDKELKMHDIFIGLISCYIVNNKHIHVHTSKETLDNKLSSLNSDEFFNWCISLQTPEQLKSGGHINAIYSDKIKSLLKIAGFKNITILSNGESLNNDLQKLLKSIERKTKRSLYSIYVESN